MSASAEQSSIITESVVPRLTIRLVGDTLEFAFPYDPVLVSAIRQVNGRRWNPAAKVWTAPIASAADVQELLDRMPAGTVLFRDGADKAIAARLRLHTDSLAASRAEDRADIEIPVPEGLSYLPYQRAGIAYALGRPNTLFGDEMGLGKTIQLIGVVNADASVRRAAIVCPASLKLNWRREIEKWSVRKPLVLVGEGRPPSAARTWDALFGAFFRRLNGEIAEGVQWLIVNYDIIERWYELLAGAHLDVLGMDEAHYAKNPKAKRTQYLLGKYDRDPEKRIEPLAARRKLALTGTPIPNRPIEAWPLVHALAPDTFKSWKFYVERFCGGGRGAYGYDVSGASNLGELQEKLRGSIMVRRLKADVLKELPAKRRQVIELPAADAAQSQIVKSEVTAYEAGQERLLRLRAAVELAKASDSWDEYQAAVKALKEASLAAFTELSKLRHAVALAKLPLVIEHLRESLADGRKVILFLHHRDCVAKVAEAFPGSVQITGETSMEDRQQAVDDFQKNSDCRLFIGNIRAAGVGLTLTASSHVIFGELDWVPGNVTQAEDRAHRIGQTDSVLAQHLVLEGSLDARMARVLIEKQEVIDRALDKEPEEDDTPVVPLKLSERPATEGVTRKQIVAEARQFEPATPLAPPTPRMLAIHQGLRILAGVCDGAGAKDHAGFSKIDVMVGHSLAGADRLTPKQAVLGQRLVRKYRRQLPSDLLATALAEEVAQ